MLVEIFCQIDDFCKLLNNKNVLPKNNESKAGRKRMLQLSEIMTIMVYFHMTKIKSFKEFYQVHIKKIHRGDFPKAPSYNRFIELRQEALIPMLLYLQVHGTGNCDGISVIDSSPLRVCHVLRSSSHKLFKGIAKKSKTSTGWFFGFKIHLVINSKGEIVNFFITPANVADNDHEVLEKMTQDIFGKLIADKGYIGAFKQLYDKGIELIHGIRKNMKNKLVKLENKLLLSKRGVIESVLNILKQWMSLEYTLHRSKIAYFAQICSTLVAYNFKPNKPQLFSSENLAQFAAC
jgi:hypothetical protein